MGYWHSRPYRRCGHLGRRTIAELRYIRNGREQSLSSEHIHDVHTGDGTSSVVILEDTQGIRYPLDQPQAVMVARQAWTAHKSAVKSCAHCYWHDRRESREGCEALQCRMREAAAVLGEELQAYARPQEEPTENPVRVAVSNWLLKHVLLFGFCRAVGVPIGLYLSALFGLLGVLAARRYYYYYRSHEYSETLK